MKYFLFLFRTLFFVLVSPTLSHACAMGFSFHFEPLPEHFGSKSISLKSFLDRTYAKRGWEWAKSPQNIKRPLHIEAPKHPENSARIAVSVGSRSPDLLGVYERFSVFRMNRVTVIEFAGEKEVAKRLPNRVPISGMKHFGPFSGKTSQIDSGIEKIADFKLSKFAMPFAKLRIRAGGVSGIRLFASFVPIDDKALIQVVRAQRKIEAGPMNPCYRTLYVFGRWPENLRKTYRYE